MKRDEFYRVRRPSGDPKPARVFVVASRQPLIDSTYSTVICAPAFTREKLPELDDALLVASGIPTGARPSA